MNTKRYFLILPCLFFIFGACSAMEGDDWLADWGNVIKEDPFFVTLKDYLKKFNSIGDAAISTLENELEIAQKSGINISTRSQQQKFITEILEENLKDSKELLRDASAKEEEKRFHIQFQVLVNNYLLPNLIQATKDIKANAAIIECGGNETWKKKQRKKPSMQTINEAFAAKNQFLNQLKELLKFNNKNHAELETLSTYTKIQQQMSELEAEAQK